MSLDIETRLRVLLASAPPALRRVPTLELSHSAMSQTWYLWREPYEGTITTEDGARTVQPVNLSIELAGDEGHLDQSYDIRLDTTEVNDTFRAEMDGIPIDTLERIRCVYREYLSDDLATVVAGPAVLQVESIAYRRGVAAISAVSPRLNITRTGEAYTARDVPMLRGFL